MAVIYLNLLVLKTRQVGKLRTFYQTIGIELSQEKHGNGPIHFAGQIEDGVFELYPSSDELVERSTRLGMSVSNLTDTGLHRNMAGR